MDSRTADILLIFGKQDPSDWVLEALSASGLSAISATSAEDAKELILKENFQTIVAGVHIEDWPLEEVVSFVRRVGITPLLFFSDTSSESDTEAARYLLRYDILHLPVSPSEFLKALAEVSAAPRDFLPNCELSEEFQEFVSIRIQEYVTGSRLSYDTFIKIGVNRFVKFSHGNDGFGVDLVKRLKEKEISTVYLRKSDFLEYIRFNSRIIDNLSLKELSRERKSKFIQQSFSVLGRSVILGEMEGADVNGAIALVSSTMELVFKNDDAFLALELLKNTQANIFYHSLNIAVYVSLMASRLGWTSSQTQEKLILSALYHDVGILKLPKILSEIPEVDRTPEEQMIFQKHVDHSCEILRAIGGFSEEVISIISQHHEKDSGNGYPMMLRRKQISSLAKVVRIADEFCDFMAIQQAVNFGTINQGLRRLEEKVGLEYEQVYVSAFLTLFKKVIQKSYKCG